MPPRKPQPRRQPTAASRNIPVCLRLPPKLVDDLKRRAAAQKRTLSAQVLHELTEAHR